VPPNTECIFAQVNYDYGEEVDFSKGYWNPKIKMRETTHFSDKIKQPFSNSFQILSSIISENAWLSAIFEF